MNTIKLAGQVISSTNYATDRLFVFTPELLQAAADNFLRSGMNEIEIPVGFLDPERKFPEQGIDKEAVKRTKELLPGETVVIGSYISGTDLEKSKRDIDLMVESFPSMKYVMLHPPGPKEGEPEKVKATVDIWAQLAEHAASRRDGFQCCLHNHFDTSCETADQVRGYLDLVREAGVPSLRWGPDTGHCHGMHDEYLAVFEEYAPLIGNHFHIKASVPAFDQMHGGDKYAPARDIWGNKAEHGRGLYGGFVNCADPEIETPFADVFAIIREKAQPTDGVVTGAVEIDIPRQHPRLEAMCSALYMKQVHGVETGLALDCDEIVRRVFS